MERNLEVLEFELNDKQIDEMISKLNELKESQEHIHYDLPNKQMNVIGDNIEIMEILIHHEKDELK
ncbi:MAG: hypothetical protein IIA87_01860 [Nanoarchaeota archaeon]|nr:hypothetical protein [Nanoarchaeota archaeon]